MYRQTDGVPMGSPLVPALTNIFVGYQKTKLFLNVKNPLIYQRYVDDTFAVFENEDDSEEFLSSLNFFHSSLCITFEKELNSSFPFLDVLVEKHKTGFITSVYRKPTCTGQYIHCDFFSPMNRKINLVATLVHRALFIYSNSLNLTKMLVNAIESLAKLTPTQLALPTPKPLRQQKLFFSSQCF